MAIKENDFLEAFKGQKRPEQTFYRSSLLTKSSKGLLTGLMRIEDDLQIFLWIEDLLQDFNGQKIFYESFMNRRPSKGLLWTETLLQIAFGGGSSIDPQWMKDVQKVLCGWKTFYRFSTIEDFLEVFYGQRNFIISSKNTRPVFFAYKTFKPVLYNTFYRSSMERKPSTGLS